MKFVEKNSDERGKWRTALVWIFGAPMSQTEQVQRKFEAATPTMVSKNSVHNEACNVTVELVGPYHNLL